MCQSTRASPQGLALRLASVIAKNTSETELPHNEYTTMSPLHGYSANICTLPLLNNPTDEFVMKNNVPSIPPAVCHYRIDKNRPLFLPFSWNQQDRNADKSAQCRPDQMQGTAWWSAQLSTTARRLDLAHSNIGTGRHRISNNFERYGFSRITGV